MRACWIASWCWSKRSTRQRGDTNARVRGLEELIQKLLERHQLQGRELRPGDSMSVRSEGDQQHVRQLVGEYLALPEEQRRQRPDLLNKMGVLRAAAGELEEAQKDFQDAAKLASDPKAKAEAHHNAYRAALERQAWGEALASLREAVAADPVRFAPFAFDRYDPSASGGRRLRRRIPLSGPLLGAARRRQVAAAVRNGPYHRRCVRRGQGAGGSDSPGHHPTMALRLRRRLRGRGPTW